MKKLFLNFIFNIKTIPINISKTWKKYKNNSATYNAHFINYKRDI